MICKVCGCPDVKWLRVRVVADRFECSGKKVRRLLLSGRLEGMRLGREWRVLHESLDRLVREWSLEGQGDSGVNNSDVRPI